MAGDTLPPVRINGHVFQPRDEIHRRKLEALRAFARFLLSGPAREQIAKIILFGSVAKGDARPESDVDVAVYGFGDLQLLREQVYDAAQETWCQEREGIEPLVEDAFALLEPAGVVDKFGELFCRTEILPRELGRRVRQGLEIRSQARYRPAAEITAEKVEHNLALARELLGHLEKALEGELR